MRNNTATVNSFLNKLAKGMLALTFAATGALASAPSANAAALDACTDPNAKTIICASLDMMTLQHGTDTAVLAAPNVKASPAWTTINFNFNSDASNAGLIANLVFFDKSGTDVQLPAASPGTSSKCDSNQAAQGRCNFTLDSNGDAVIPITFLNLSEGDSIKYQFEGQTAWRSGFRMIKFTSNWDGHLPKPTAACAPDSENACPAIELVKVAQGDFQPRFYLNGEKVNGKDVRRADSDVNTPTIKFSLDLGSTNAGLIAQVQFFDITGASLQLPTAAAVASNTCLASIASGNGCSVILDSKGSAAFDANFVGAAVGSNFKYKIVAPGFGSEYTEVKFAVVPIIYAKLSGKKVSITFKNLRAAKASISITGLKKASKTIASANQTLKFTTTKGSRKVTVTVGAIKYTVTFRVK